MRWLRCRAIRRGLHLDRCENALQDARVHVLGHASFGAEVVEELLDGLALLDLPEGGADGRKKSEVEEGVLGVPCRRMRRRRSSR